jgi:hypothetical protein
MQASQGMPEYFHDLQTTLRKVFFERDTLLQEFTFEYGVF